MTKPASIKRKARPFARDLYGKTADLARQELKELEEQKGNLDRRIIILREAVRSLEKMSKE
jgi:hypothetical protein